MIKGNITKSVHGMYTVSIFDGQQRMFKVNNIKSLQEAQDVLRTEKASAQGLLGALGVDEDYKRSYPEFEGRIISWRNKNFRNGRIQKVLVAGVDYDIGVTFVNPKNSKDYFTCYNGPASPERKKNPKSMISIDRYNKAFKYIIDTLKNDRVYDVQEVHDAYGHTPSFFGGYLSPCAFGA